MRILLVNDYAVPAGGAEISTLVLRQGLRQRGHDARLLASTARPLAGGSLADYECIGTLSRFRTLLQSANPWAPWKLRQVLREFQPDVVHVSLFLTQLSPLILPLLNGVPSLYHVHWYRPICPLGTKSLPDGTTCNSLAGMVCYRNGCLPLRDWLPLMGQMWAWRRWKRHFDMIVPNSEATRRRLIGAGIDAVAPVRYGVPILPQRPPLCFPPTVAFAGRLVWQKGMEILLQAFAKVVARLPDALLLVAGDGPEWERLERVIADHQLIASVRMLGHVPHQQLEADLSAAWIRVVPSRWEEPFGIAAVEAMMRGTAVVASRSGGLTEIVRHEFTGLLVPPGEPGVLADALLLLLTNRNLAERLGRNGREVALADFSEDVFVERFLGLYRELLAGDGPAAGKAGSTRCIDAGPRIGPGA